MREKSVARVSPFPLISHTKYCESCLMNEKQKVDDCWCKMVIKKRESEREDDGLGILRMEKKKK